MLRIRPAAQRGVARFDGVDSRHSFSFGDYFDPEFMGFRALRVINEDRVAAKTGFPRHPHRDMEILTYVLSGQLEHKDSLGNGAIIKPGEIQYMSAGSGIQHSEMNPSKDEQVHLLQIWILPTQRGTPPRYGQNAIEGYKQPGKVCLLASKDGRDGSIEIRQDVDLFAAFPSAKQPVTIALKDNRAAWIQVAGGSVRVNGKALGQGDGASSEGDSALRIESDSDAEVLVFDMV